MHSNFQWRETEQAARAANGRGERTLAICLIAQSVTEARDPSLPWHELQSALAGSALFHEHITLDFEKAIEHYQESYRILAENTGSESRESISFAGCLADCKAKLNADR